MTENGHAWHLSMAWIGLDEEKLNMYFNASVHVQ